MHTTLTRPANAQAGYTLIELLVSMATATIVLGGATMLTSQVQNGYRRTMEDAVAVQEGRFALDWIGRLVRGAGNNPFNVITSDCPSAAFAFQAIRFDPDLDGIDNDIRLQSDSNPPDGNVGGTAGTCDQSNEDVTISLDAANDVIVFLDNNLGGGAAVRTDKVIEDLRFRYRDSAHNITAIAADVVFVEIDITVRTRTLNAANNAPVTRVLSSDIRVRSK